MFRNDDDEDFDVELDDEVAAPHKPAANQDKENWPNRTVLASQEDWGSDDDESVFLDIDTTVIDQPPVHQVKVVEVVKTVPEPEPEICVRKFPGPAGLISKANAGRNAAGNYIESRKLDAIEVDMNGVYRWSEALAKLGVAPHWVATKNNIQWMKSNYLPCTYVSVKVPLLVAGVKCVQSARADLNCILQDPSGETRSTIHQAVVEEHAGKIRAGSVLLLRRPAVCISGSSPHLVTVTKKSLVAIVSSHQEYAHLQVTRCAAFAGRDLETWSREAAECQGLECEPADDDDDNDNDDRQRQGLQRLFTTHHASPGAAGARLKAPTSRSTSLAAGRAAVSPLQQRPVVRSAPVPSFRAPAPPVRAPAPSFRAPAPVARAPPAAAVAVRAAAPPPPPPAPAPAPADERFIEQFLDGIDTDALFDDF